MPGRVKLGRLEGGHTQGMLYKEGGRLNWKKG